MQQSKKKLKIVRAEDDETENRPKRSRKAILWALILAEFLILLAELTVWAWLLRR